MKKIRKYINGSWQTVTICPPGPVNETVQAYAFDEYLGTGGLVHKPDPSSATVGGDKSIYASLAATLGPCYKALEEVAEQDRDK